MTGESCRAERTKVGCGEMGGDERFTGHIAVLTGASIGIGRRIGIAIAQEGVQSGSVDRNHGTPAKMLFEKQL